MNREQQEVLSLLKEIDAVCRKHQIVYYLSPRLTLCAIEGRPFPLNPLAGVVFMKLPDMERFRQVMEAELMEGRALESMKNNKRFPGLFLRYENKNTLCYRLYEGRNFQYPGIGVDILPLRKKNPSKKVRSWDQRMEVGWVQMCDSAKYKLDFYKFICGLGTRLLSIGGRARLGEKIYDRLCANQWNPSEKGGYTLRWNRNDIYTYPAEIFQETKEVLWEGTGFLIPGDEERYLRLTFGARYANRKFNETGVNFSLMVSARVGCEEFLQEAGPLKDLIKARRRYFLMDNHMHRYKEYFNWCWNYAKTCASRQELRMHYSDQKEYIQNIWEERDMDSLDTVFQPFTRIMKKCLETEEIFEADEEILEIYLSYLRETGKEKLLSRIEAYR